MPETTQNQATWPRPATIGLHLGLGLLAAAGAAALTWLLWDQAGLGDRALAGSLAAAARPRGLRLFACLATPLAAWLTSLALGLILWLAPPTARAHRPELPRHLLRADALIYLALPACAALPMVWSQLGNGLAALGLIHLGLVTAKAGLLAWALWGAGLAAAPEPGRGLGVKRQAAVCLAAWVVLGSLAGWGHQALSSASDEVGYLLIAHSLARHHTSDVHPAVAAGEQEAFYWARWSPELAFGADQARGLFPWLITPAYWLGGRLGVLVFLAGLLALTLGQLLSWLAECRIRPGPAAAAAALACLSAPVLLISQQVFPDTAGMLLFVLGLRLLLRLEDAPWPRGLGLAACALAMAALKSRLAPLAGGLALVGAAQLLARRLGWRTAAALFAAVLAVAGLLAAFLPQAWWPAGVWPQVDVARWNLERAYYFLQPVVVLVRGLALDQTFGLMFTAPIFLLALAGLPAGLKHHRRPVLQLLIPLAIYVIILAYTRWFQWYGGFAGPARFLAACLPALALPLALALGALWRPWRRLALWFVAAAGLIYALLANLVAQFRYARPLGVNPLVAALQDHLGLDLHHLLPSAFTLSPTLRPWAALALALAAVLAWLTWRDQAAASAPEPAASPDQTALELTLLPLTLALALLGLLAAGRLMPPYFAEAEQMRRSEAALWAEYDYPNQMRGAVLLDGGRIEGRVFLAGGEAVLRAVGWPEADGELVVRFRDAVVRWRWPMHHRQVEMPLGQRPRGYQEISISWSSCPGRACALLVDRVEALPVSSR
ncbi:MAG: hypothetical protein ACOZHQ_08750 [Thermodesulfobacteriota bacterium]